MSLRASLRPAVALTLLALAVACAPATRQPAVPEVPASDFSTISPELKIETADELIVIEEQERVVEDPVIKDAKVSDHNESDSESLGDPRFNSDAPFEGPGTNGTIGIGGGAGSRLMRRSRRMKARGGGRGGGGGGAGAPAAPKQGRLEGKNATGERLGAFPLEHTDVAAKASGWIATTRVTQTFGNPFQEVVEAVYVFPLPTSAAVNEFEMRVQGRRIVGIVRPREEAQRIYAEARARGQTASLLSQERPNIFTQSVANIAPGEQVEVGLTFFHELAYDRGAFTYAFPLVVAPRYVPGKASPGEASPGDVAPVIGGGGVSADTDAVPDASRISPPVLPEGMRSGHDVSLTLSIAAGLAMRDISSPTHEVAVARDGDERATVTLSDADTIANRDFVARWQVSGDELLPGVITHRTAETGGFFSAFVVPQADPGDAAVTPREVTFVLDTSGSMRGIPMDASRRVAKRTLENLRPYDRFNIIRFAGSSGSLAEQPMERTAENLAAGLAYLDGLRGGGGTEMLAGLNAWLAQPADPRYMRVVVFLTDGHVGNEEQILSLIKGDGQDARWFAFGIGSSVNRYLIEGIAEQGNGTAEVVLPREAEAANAAADRLVQRFDSPVLVDVEIDTGDLPITDIYPKKVPDLFAGQPIRVTGRYTAAAAGTITFRGRVGARWIELPVEVTLPEENTDHAALAPIWARSRVAALSNDLLGADDTERTRLLKEIESLGVEFRLVTQRTSFVAVDESRTIGDGTALRVLQPVELPQDMDREGTTGVAAGTRRALRIAAWGVTVIEEDGGLRVLALDAETSSSGLVVGERITRYGGHALRGARHLEALALQTSAATVEVGVETGTGDAATLRNVTLTRP